MVNSRIGYTIYVNVRNQQVSVLPLGTVTTDNVGGIHTTLINNISVQFQASDNLTPSRFVILDEVSFILPEDVTILNKIDDDRVTTYFSKTEAHELMKFISFGDRII